MENKNTKSSLEIGGWQQDADLINLIIHADRW